MAIVYFGHWIKRIATKSIKGIGQQMAHICTCKYPLIIVDSRDSQEISYLAFPIETIEEGEVPVPDIDYIETEGLDGIVRQYVKVTWAKPDHTNVKKYDVVGHIITAGCHPSEASTEPDGKLHCDEKDIYEVLHPVEEWIDHHIIVLPSENEKSNKAGT